MHACIAPIKPFGVISGMFVTDTDTSKKVNIGHTDNRSIPRWHSNTLQSWRALQCIMFLCSKTQVLLRIGIMHRREGVLGYIGSYTMQQCSGADKLYASSICQLHAQNISFFQPTLDKKPFKLHRETFS